MKESIPLLGGKKLTIYDLTKLVEEVEIYQLGAGENERSEFERIYDELTELWFKSRMEERDSSDFDFKVQCEIDQLYIRNALMILKSKFKKYWNER